MNVALELFKKMPSRIADILVHIFYGRKQGDSATLRNYYAQRYKVYVGKYSYGGCFSKEFNLGGEVSVGRYCSIAGNVHYFGANHPMDSVSTSAYFYNKNLSKHDVKDVLRSKLEIGNDVWIGYGVIITCGCKQIGTGAVIGAGSVVTHDVPEYAIVAGNPARVIRYRGTDESRILMIDSKWWERELEDVIQYYTYMDNPEAFVNKLNSNGNSK